MLNKIVIMGRMVKDPELRRTQSGTPVASFTLAVERDIPKQDGTRDTDFIDCVAFKGTAEFIDRNFEKGNMVVIAGRLQIRNWEDKNGSKRRSAEIVVSDSYFCGSKPSATSSGNDTNVGADSFSDQFTGSDFTELSESNDDLPF